MRGQYAYLLFKVLAHNFDRLQKVRIVRDNDRHVKPVHMGIMQQMCGKVYVRPFFLGLDDPRIFLRLSRRHDQRHGDLVRQEVTKMNGDLGERAQRPQIKLLPDGLVQVTRAGGYQSREILDLCYGVFRQQKLAKCFRIQPAIRGIAKRPIVKIEAIYVDVCVQKSLLKMQKPPARRLRARPPKRPGGYQN